MPILPIHHQPVAHASRRHHPTEHTLPRQSSGFGLLALQASADVVMRPLRRLKLVDDIEQEGLYLESVSGRQSQSLGVAWGTALGLGIPTAMAAAGSGATGWALGYFGNIQCRSNLGAFMFGAGFVELVLAPRLFVSAARDLCIDDSSARTMKAFCTAVFASIVGGGIASGLHAGASLGSTPAICSAQAATANPLFPLLCALLYRQYQHASHKRMHSGAEDRHRS